jgi:DNA-directed RNA polymerase subunit beta'
MTEKRVVKNDFGNASEFVIGLTSPETILDRSSGAVTQPETINYKTYRPEVNGLFCEKIFGPSRDWECHCGKYKGIRYKNIICDRCGVEITHKKVRRERVGHIKLVVPIVHIWYFKSLPNKIGNLLGLSSKKLDQIVYYERYVVIQPGIKSSSGIEYMDFFTEEEYLNIMDTLPAENKLLDDSDQNKFIISTGAEAIKLLLQRLNLDALSVSLRNSIMNETSQQRKLDAIKKLKIVEAFRDSNKRISNKPEWMVMDVIPVIPPDLRPLTPLQGGTFATSDINDLYRRIIIRNNRLKRLIDINAPEVILRNEKRMLQESVDSLFDNSRKSNTVASEAGRPLKSLSDMLKGKQGRFRQNLLGKRVDYSGRSIIVVGPELKMHECGLPKDMALELFKPFVIRRLMDRGVVKTIKSAKKLIENKLEVVWDVLEYVMRGHPVLLNRAPTLHRLSIQAFQPKLIESKAIQLHPLTCAAFNADFDGDQMAVHVPLSQEAIAEATLLMLSSYNILNPANGAPIALPSKDMVLGLYYLTKGRRSTPEFPMKGEGMFFSDLEEVIIAINNKAISKNTYINLRTKVLNEKGELEESIIETVAGRAVFNKVMPAQLGFVDDLLTKKKLQSIVAKVYKITGMITTAKFLDDIKNLGFQYIHQGGLTFSLDDIKVPTEKQSILARSQEEVTAVWDNYYAGLITDTERYNQIIDIWTMANTEITNLLLRDLENDQDGFNCIYMMMHSGARGAIEQIRQLGGMRGMMAKLQKSKETSEGVIETPIVRSFKEGLDVIGYFISTHGARKGLSDSALRTADAGYLTRRLVDAAQDVTIKEEDCGTLRGLRITAIIVNDEVIVPLDARILGRVSLYDVHDPLTEEILVRSNEEITEEVVDKIDKTNIEGVYVRSVLTCEAKKGVCIKCYGRSLASGRMVQVGEAIGVIAAQSIGEPGTQLTLRTFHAGGIASNIATESSINAKFAGLVKFVNLKSVTTGGTSDKIDVVTGRACEVKIVDPADHNTVYMSSHLPYGAYLNVKEGDHVEKNQKICYWDPYNVVILSEVAGTVKFDSIEKDITYKEEYDEQSGHRGKVIIDSKEKIKSPAINILGHDGSVIAVHNIPVNAYLSVEDGEEIYPGHILAKLPRLMSKSGDITGGLPRIVELFEARNKANSAIVTDIDGYVRYGEIKRGNREIYVEANGGFSKKYLVPLSKHILVQDGDYVESCSRLSDGVISISDILSIKGVKAAQAYIVNQIQDVYRLQGVTINDKHLEVIVRQMMQKVEVVDSGDTLLLLNQVVSKAAFAEENNKVLGKHLVTEAGDTTLFTVGQLVELKDIEEENERLTSLNLKTVTVRAAVPATAAPKLQGITQASIDNDSFISAASFQDTTKVLSDAAVWGRRDVLEGLKENIIVGNLIPVGTGMSKYRDLIVYSKEEYERLEQSSETL